MKISVVVPCRNGEVFLAQALTSVLNQTLPPLDVIVVDDGSTDESAAIARSFGDPVRVFSGSRGGASAARGFGTPFAQGDALMFLDADDVVGQSAVGAMAAVLARHPDAIACCPWYRLEKLNGHWFPGPPSCAPRRPGQDELSAWLTGWYYPPCSILWSRAAFERSGGWDSTAGVNPNDDGDIMMRALAKGVALIPTTAGAAYYRRAAPGKTSLSAAGRTLPGLESRLRVINGIARLLEQNGQISKYRSSLGEAYDAVAKGCKGRYPQLSRECRAAARHYAGPDWLRAGRGMRRKFILAFGRSTPAEAQNGAELESGMNPVRRRAEGPGHPAVSVIVPAYNRSALLPRALARQHLGPEFPGLRGASGGRCIHRQHIRSGSRLSRSAYPVLEAG